MEIALFFSILGLLSISVVGFGLRGRTGGAVLAAVVGTLFIRVAQQLGGQMYIWHDGFFYFAGAESILATNSLAPSQAVELWYPAVEVQLGWFAYQLNTAIGAIVVGIESVPILRAYTPALLGPLTFFAAWVAYRPVIGQRYALVGGYLFAMMDLVISYQTQYHAQGFATVVYVFLLGLLASLLVRRQSIDRRYVGVLLSFVLLLVFSHHWTAAMIVIFFMALLPLLGLAHRIRPNWSLFQRPLYAVAGIFAVAFVAYNVFVNQYIFHRGVGALVDFTIPSTIWATGAGPGPFIQSSGSTILDSFSLLEKVILAALAGIGGLAALWDAHRNEDRRSTAFYLFVLLAAGVVAVITVPLSPGQLPRVIILGYFALIPLAILGLTRLSNMVVKNPVSTRAVLSVFVVGMVLMTAPSGITPSLIDHDADISADTYHNVDPLGNQGTSGGQWIQLSIPADDHINTTFRTRMVATYYGSHSSSRISYIIPGTSCPQWAVFDEARQPAPPPTGNSVYSNGRIMVADGC